MIALYNTGLIHALPAGALSSADLLAFARAFNNTPVGWTASSAQPCNWTGVACQPVATDGSQHFALDLSGQQMGGELLGAAPSCQLAELMPLHLCCREAGSILGSSAQLQRADKPQSFL